MNFPLCPWSLFFPMPNAPYFSARGCANGYAQYKCPMPLSVECFIKFLSSTSLF